jgi:pimeloyl-ACP methyl ester carboxylesterase
MTCHMNHGATGLAERRRSRHVSAFHRDFAQYPLDQPESFPDDQRSPKTISSLRGHLEMIARTLFLMVLSAAAPLEAQTKTCPLPSTFRIEDIRFRRGENALAGVLVVPEAPGQHPGVAFVAGSGPVDHTHYGVAPHLWKHFAGQGIVCLFWDKPGVGRSTGDFNDQSFPDRAEEALEAVRFLRGRAEVSTTAVGLWGHSQGGIVVPLSASMSPDIAFVIEVGGSQVLAWKQDIFRVESELRADGFAEGDIQEAVAFARKRMSLIRGAGEFEELESAHAAVENKTWFTHVGRCDRKLFYSARKVVEYNPGPTWEKVHCPVLVIYGANDRSLPPEESLPIIRRGLDKARNPDVTIKVFPRADHGLMVSDTGGPKEARDRTRAKKPADAPAFAPGYLEFMSGWINERFGKRPEVRPNDEGQRNHEDHRKHEIHENEH